MDGFTVAAALANRATTDPERDFLLFQERIFAFGQVESQAEALAAALYNLGGVRAGDRVALVLPGWPEFVISMFAAAKLGAVIVPLNPLLTRPELHYRLRHSEAGVVITAESFRGVDLLHLFEDLRDQLPDFRYLVTVGEEDLWYDDRVFQFEDLLSAGLGRDFESPELDPGDASFAIVYTPGTTGKPKGVELSHSNLISVAAGTADAIALRDSDRVIGVTALFHVFGIGPGILGCVLSGASLILQDEFDASATLDLVERHRATVHYGLPTLFRTELHEQRLRPRELDSLRAGLVAGAPASEEVLRAIREELCPRVQIAYSITETSSTVCVTRPEDPPEKQNFTVGRPLSGTSVRIFERAGGILPVESLGEIAVKGPGVMKGYYRQPQETSKSLDKDGYFLSGDLGVLDEGGYLHLVGRRKEVIIRGGFSVYPREVEDRLHGHPAVADAAAVGVPDELLGEALCACIVPVEGAIVTGQEIKEWCRVTLADYKIPDLVRFLDAFPLSGSGKIRRVELARMMEAEELSRRDH
jgi:acyl-CoA synthetase (AMP-forming)/AMP-acid ligase II